MENYYYCSDVKISKHKKMKTVFLFVKNQKKNKLNTNFVRIRRVCKLEFLMELN